MTAATDAGRRRNRLGRGALAAAASVVGALIVAPAANAAQTFGSNLSADVVGTYGSASPRTWSNGALPPASTAGTVNSPIDGVVVRWRIKVKALSAPPLITPRITRPGDSDTRTGAGTGTGITPDVGAVDTTTTSDTRLPVLAGDGFAIDAGVGNLDAFRIGTVGATAYVWDPALADGGAAVAGGIIDTELQVLINADVEADADNDGYGDETQDTCPTDASTQGACPVAQQPTSTPQPKAKKKKCKKGFKLKKIKKKGKKPKKKCVKAKKKKKK